MAISLPKFFLVFKQMSFKSETCLCVVDFSAQSLPCFSSFSWCYLPHVFLHSLHSHISGSSSCFERISFWPTISWKSVCPWPHVLLPLKYLLLYIANNRFPPWVYQLSYREVCLGDSLMFQQFLDVSNTLKGLYKYFFNKVNFSTMALFWTLALLFYIHIYF